MLCPTYSVRHLQIYHKYKGQGVPFPPDFRAMLPRYRDPTIGVSLGAREYRTSRRVKRHGSQKQGSPPVAGDATLPSELPQENQDVLKKLREMKLGAHIDHAHSISIGRLGEKHYLMIVIDGIDFVWSQTCQVQTIPEDLLDEFLTMSHLKISTIRFDDASEFGKISSFIAYCTQPDIVSALLGSYTNIQKARSDGTIRICKEHVRYLLHICLMTTACRRGKRCTPFSPSRYITIW
jgi:hypothetical protein